MQIFVFLALIIAVIAVIFALQNTLVVTVSILFWKFTGSLALVLLLAIAIGVLISFLASLPAIVRGKWSMRSLRKRSTELKSNLDTHTQRLADLESNLTEHKQRLTASESSLAEYKQRLTESESSLAEYKQRFEEAQLKLQAQSNPVQPPPAGSQPPDQPA